MINKVLTRITGRDAASDEFTYETAARRACETAEGAHALCARLKQIATSLDSAAGRQLAIRQSEAVATLAASAQLRSELQERIPEVLRRDEAQERAALEVVESNIKTLRSKLAECEAKHAGSQRALSEMGTKLAGAAGANDDAVEGARRAMLSAHLQGDEAAIATAEAQFGKAYAARSAREREAVVEVERLSVQREVAQRHEEEVTRTRAELAEAEDQRATRLFFWDAIQSDRVMLDALVAHTRSVVSARRVPRGGTGGSVGDAVFRFYRLERAPMWDGKSQYGSVPGYTIAQIREAMKEPDWNLFAVDPASLQDVSPEQTTSALAV